MAKTVELKRESDPHQFGFMKVLTIKVEVEGEVFGFEHRYPDEYTRGRQNEFDKYLLESAKRKLGEAIVEKLLPNL